MSAWITIGGLFALALAFTLAEIFLTEDDAQSDALVAGMARK